MKKRQLGQIRRNGRPGTPGHHPQICNHATRATCALRSFPRRAFGEHGRLTFEKTRAPKFLLRERSPAPRGVQRRPEGSYGEALETTSDFFLGQPPPAAATRFGITLIRRTLVCTIEHAVALARVVNDRQPRSPFCSASKETHRVGRITVLVSCVVETQKTKQACSAIAPHTGRPMIGTMTRSPCP